MKVKTTILKDELTKKQVEEEIIGIQEEVINEKSFMYNDALFTIEYERWYNDLGESVSKSLLKYDGIPVMDEVSPMRVSFSRRDMIKEFFKRKNNK